MIDSLVLSTADLGALVFFLAVWALYGTAVNGRLVRRVSLTTAMNAQRESWMRTMAKRELRMIDTSIMLGLQQGTAFFASSSLLAIGGCFALLGASTEVMGILRDLPIADAPSRSVFEIKVVGLIVLLAHAFFKFGWAYRLFNYCSILIGAVPVLREEAGHPAETEAAVLRAARMNVLAGKHFNGGLRAVFFSIGYLGWFIDPAVLMLTTVLLLAVLLRRQFFSAARLAVLTDAPVQSGPGKTESIRPESR